MKWDTVFPETPESFRGRRNPKKQQKMKTRFLITVAILLATTLTSPAEKAEDYAKSAVSLIRYLTDQEWNTLKPTGPSFQGTAWFYHSPKYLITIGHMVQDPDLPKEVWSQFELFKEEKEAETINPKEIKRGKMVLMRLHFLIPCEGENIAILELREPIAGAKVLKASPGELRKEDPVFSVGYSSGNLRFATGSFHSIAGRGCEDPLQRNFALFELFRGNDRLAMDLGSSGAPIMNHKGEVVAVVSSVLAQDMMLFGVKRRVGSAWTRPTNTAVLIPKALMEMKFPKE